MKRRQKREVGWGRPLPLSAIMRMESSGMPRPKANSLNSSSRPSRSCGSRPARGEQRRHLEPGAWAGRTRGHVALRFSLRGSLKLLVQLDLFSAFMQRPAPGEEGMSPPRRPPRSPKSPQRALPQVSLGPEGSGILRF